MGITRNADNTSGDAPPAHLFWGKTPEKDEEGQCENLYHPLIFHMLDVASVAGLLWDNCFPATMKDRLRLSLGKRAREIAIFFAGAHDIGKASPAFQKKQPEIAKLLSSRGFRFSSYDIPQPHGFISVHALREFFKDGDTVSLLSRISGAHHGVFPRSENLKMRQASLGGEQWTKARIGLLRDIEVALDMDMKSCVQTIGEIKDPAVVPVLAGFISVVDWIASSQRYFPCETVPGSTVPPLDDYRKESEARARGSLESLGWIPAIAMPGEADFSSLFPDLTPNDLQRKVVELTDKKGSPYLMIIEAPMGSGKTEAALFAADREMCRKSAQGMYVAMPTQATSNAMFRRVMDDYLKTRGIQNVNLLLVHSDAMLALGDTVREGELLDFRPSSTEENGDEQGDAQVQSWFTARKRPLLAPLGVGTVDQSLMSVLQTRHWFVRLFGLAGKVVVFDEVGAGWGCLDRFS